MSDIQPISIEQAAIRVLTAYHRVKDTADSLPAQALRLNERGLERWEDDNALASIADERGLSGEEAEAALATFVPPGAYDEYFIFSSGGHSGQLHVIGVPSMRLLKTIPVFSPDSWSGYGFGWQLDSLDGHRRVFHGGSLPGFRAQMMRFPDDSLTVIVLTNGDGARPEQVARDVARMYLSGADRARR